MSHSLEQVLNGDITTRLVNPEERKILWNNSEDSAGVYVPTGVNRFLFAESCDFNPMPRRFWETDDDEAPFHTEADQLILDLDSIRYALLHNSYEEGDVQGLVFAVDSIEHGGKLEPSDYWDRINGWIHEAHEQKDVWTSMGQPAINKYLELGFIQEARG